MHRLRTDATVRRDQWVALADVSPALRTALVLSEDKRFYEHSGGVGECVEHQKDAAPPPSPCSWPACSTKI